VQHQIDDALGKSQNIGSFGAANSHDQRQMRTLRKVGAEMLQKALFPSKAHLKQGMKLFDLAVKVEYIMMEMMSNMLYGSVLEVGIFVVMILLFVEDS
jgi:hypothetical protein